MSSNVKSATAYFVCKDAIAAIEFYKTAFGAVENFRMTDPTSGKLGHAELQFGEAVFMLSDEWPDFGAISPDTLGGTPVSLYLSCNDVDSLVADAVAAGAILTRKPADQSFGERVAMVIDPYGHRWMLSQNIEDVSPAEMQRRWEAETSA